MTAKELIAMVHNDCAESVGATPDTTAEWRDRLREALDLFPEQSLTITIHTEGVIEIEGAPPEIKLIDLRPDGGVALVRTAEE